MHGIVHQMSLLVWVPEWNARCGSGGRVHSCFWEHGLVIMSSLHWLHTMQCFVGMGVFAVRLGAGMLPPQLTVVRLLVVGNGGVCRVDLSCGQLMWVQLLWCEL